MNDLMGAAGDRAVMDYKHVPEPQRVKVGGGVPSELPSVFVLLRERE